MLSEKDLASNDAIAWCPGCGNFGILSALKKALIKSDLDQRNILLVSGIGQAAKLPHYIKCNCFNGLHGRAIPVAVAAKIANKDLTVIVTTGDGDAYGEGGNHFLHNIRRNVDITVIVHNNQIYGLTKGQASPTTDEGYKTKVQPFGVIIEPFHALSIAIAAGAGFVARSFSKDLNHLTGLILEGIRYKGFAFIEVLQPCVTYNKKNTYEWYSERIYKLDSNHSLSDKNMALERSQEWGEKIPVGIFYKSEKRSYEEKNPLLNKVNLVDLPIEEIDLRPVLKDFF